MNLEIAQPLLDWYYQHQRILPFRQDPSPYHVWVSEVMLQQTRISAVLPYYERFIKALPDIEALARCEEDVLHKLWEGLGYYNRARNLRRTAQKVVRQYGGQLPADFDTLRSLPGIGEYTAGAIASIAYNQPVVAVDGNVLRVFSRLLASENDITLSAVKRELTVQVQRQQPADRPGDFNQALMELGALVCVPGAPHCAACPLQTQCKARAKGLASQLPHRSPPKPKQKINICVLILFNEEGVLLHHRPPVGLLAGLWEPFLYEGKYTREQIQQMLKQDIPGAQLAEDLPKSTHVFTHRVWHMYGWLGSIPKGTPLPDGDYLLATARQIDKDYAIPSAFKAYLPLLRR